MPANFREIRQIMETLFNLGFEDTFVEQGELEDDSITDREKERWDQYGAEYSLIDMESYEGWLHKHLKELPGDLYLWSGMTRVVVHQDGSDYVYKLNGLNDCCDWHDTCGNEVRVYEAATQAGLAKFFARAEEPIGIMSPAGYVIRVYAMKYVDVDDERNSNTAATYLRNLYHDDDPQAANSYWGSSETMLTYVAEAFEDGHILVDWLDAHGINDTHCGNWGWDGDQFVLIDYGGFQRSVRV